MKDNKEVCKWCEWCSIIKLKENSGICYLDIGEYVNLDDKACFAYRYDGDLDRC